MDTRTLSVCKSSSVKSAHAETGAPESSTGSRGASSRRGSSVGLLVSRSEPLTGWRSTFLNV